MEKLGLPETIEVVRTELRAAIAQAQGQDLQFPLGEVELELQIGVTREGSADGKLKVWVLELGSSGRYAHGSIQKVTLTLQAPVDAQGNPVKVVRRSQEKP